VTDYYTGEVREPGLLFDQAAMVGDHMVEKLKGLRVEQFWVMLFDMKNGLIEEVMVSQGSLQSTVVHPRETFLPAVRESAAAIIAVHNHTSGDLTPSAEDHSIMAQLREAGKILGIPMLDFIIVGSRGWRSMATEGFI